MFRAENLATTQHFATSKDGTKIPYFEVAPKDRRGAGPALIEAYGGFGTVMSPSYQPALGAAWLERGGVYVLANIRGGGEYGPAWHRAATRHLRQNSYDDLIAVAEDLVHRGVTTNARLGVMGFSNGGLLTSVMLTERPDLFGAVVSKSPLTDMKRYAELGGAGWKSEYGDPDDPEDWAALARYSPFQNVKSDVRYPPSFFIASASDDRAHPSHARKMVAKLESVGAKPLYYENMEGGHDAAADGKEAAHIDALIYTFLWTRLGGENRCYGIDR